MLLTSLHTRATHFDLVAARSQRQLQWRLPHRLAIDLHPGLHGKSLQTERRCILSCSLFKRAPVCIRGVLLRVGGDRCSRADVRCRTLLIALRQSGAQLVAYRIQFSANCGCAGAGACSDVTVFGRRLSCGRACAQKEQKCDCYWPGHNHRGHNDRYGISQKDRSCTREHRRRPLDASYIAQKILLRLKRREGKRL